MKIIMTGGGTGGHVMPNIALVPYLKKYFDEVSYIGEKDGVEEKLCAKYNIPFNCASSIKLSRRNMLENLKIPSVLNKGKKQAIAVMKRFKPDIVFSKGGYAALPACLACKALDIPLVIHESDSSLGISNKLCSLWARKVITSADKQKEKFIDIGNPIRNEIIYGNPLNIQPRVNKTKKTVLIIGGSSGAKAINDSVLASIDALTDRYNVIHITGGKCDKISAQDYFPIDFIDNIGDYYHAADVIISRAGAGAISEINAVGKRAIYIPLPKGNSRGDQVENAEKECARGRASVLRQEELSGNTLLSAIKSILKSPAPSPDYDKTINERIAKLIYDTALEDKNPSKTDTNYS